MIADSRAISSLGHLFSSRSRYFFSPSPPPICLKVKITISRELFLARFHTRHTCATCASRMPHVGGTRENTGTRRGVPHGKFWQALTIPHTSSGCSRMRRASLASMSVRDIKYQPAVRPSVRPRGWPASRIRRISMRILYARAILCHANHRTPDTRPSIIRYTRIRP